MTINYRKLPIFKNTVFLAKLEGDVYEQVAWLWFMKKRYMVLEYKHSRGPDYKVELPDGNVVYYEIKGRNLIYINKKNRVLQVPTIALSNIERELITYYLVVIYDNFLDKFKIFNISKENMDKIAGENPRSLRFYDLFEFFGMDNVLFDVNDADLSKLQYKEQKLLPPKELKLLPPKVRFMEFE